MRLSKKRAIKLHRELWDWLYRHPGLTVQKREWPEWKENGGRYYHVKAYCFLCVWVKGKGGGCLTYCPLKWPGGWCGGAKSYYVKWKDARFNYTRKRYAKQIRDLPERGKT